LAPYLFILIGEVLNYVMKEEERLGDFKSIILLEGT
jgi:hypothetical protein